MENNHVTHNAAPNLVSLPHPLTGDGREVCHLPFEPGETLGRYVVRAGVRLSRGKVVVTVNGDEKEIREYKVDQLKFRPKKRREKQSSNDAELKQLEALEKKEGKSKLDGD